MNIFILNSGRCGSSTFIEACRHISNYKAGHESLSHLVGDARLNYPANHIEADNRLSWFLGRLDRKYGDDAFYVHLTREPQAVINSFVKRESFGIMKAYRDGVLLGETATIWADDLASDYLETVDSNIRLFLKDKSRTMRFQLEQAQTDFKIFWERIGAEGDLEQALATWDTHYNASS
ncbi:MAG: hypothetical protein MI754_05165 [Chromatiales bacterium]|nr:hypothetical protein [Chromatiales bacterium]